MQERGVTGEALQAAKDGLAKAERAVRDAGGLSSGRLHLEVLSQGRKNKRKEEAIGRHEKQLQELRKRRDEAAAAVTEAEDKHDALVNDLEDGRKRYADLASQQAAESRPSEEGRDVRRALSAFSEVGASLNPQLAEHLAVLRRAAARFYPAPEDAKAVITEAGLAANSDSEISDGEDYVDDEPEITGELLAGRTNARRVLRELARQGESALMEAADKAGSAKEVLKLYHNESETARAEVEKAEAALHGARNAARARIKREEMQATAAAMGGANWGDEPEADRSRSSSSSGSGSALAPNATMAGGSPGPTAGGNIELIPCLPPSSAGEEATRAPEPVAEDTPCLQRSPTATADGGTGEDNEEVPCPPPPTWRRYENLDECGSEETIDETLVPVPSEKCGASMETMVADGAVKLAQATFRERAAAEDRRRGAEGTGARNQMVSSGIRWKQCGSDSRGRRGECGESEEGRVDRSKSPRRRQADMQLD